MPDSGTDHILLKPIPSGGVSGWVHLRLITLNSSDCICPSCEPNSVKMEDKYPCYSNSYLQLQCHVLLKVTSISLEVDLMGIIDDTNHGMKAMARGREPNAPPLKETFRLPFSVSSSKSLISVLLLFSIQSLHTERKEQITVGQCSYNLLPPPPPPPI